MCHETIKIFVNCVIKSKKNYKKATVFFKNVYVVIIKRQLFFLTHIFIDIFSNKNCMCRLHICAN